MSFTYKYPRPAVTVDAVLFGVDEEGLKILLIKRRDNPFKDCWALPGGFVDVDGDDTTEDAVARELQEETNLSNIYLEQLYTFSKKGRDPRERVVTVAYLGLVRPESLKPIAGDDAKEVGWFSVQSLPDLAFDHADIVKMGLDRIRSKVRYQPVGFELLPEMFTIVQIQNLYEKLLQRDLDRSYFHKKITAMGILTPVPYMEHGLGRPSQMYKFNRESYQQKLKEGFNFEL